MGSQVRGARKSDEPADPAGLHPPELPAAALAALHAVSRRIRLQRALDLGGRAAVAALGLAALGICLQKTGHVEPGRAVLAVAFAAPWLAALAAALRRLPPLLPAHLLDRAARTPDLIASARSFASLPAEARTPFMNACVARGAEQAARTPPASASPLHLPRAWRPVLALSAAVLALLALDLRVPAPVVARAVPKPRLLHEEDLVAVSEELASMNALAADDPALRAAMDELNRLLEALHDGAIDRLDALRELRALQERLELDATSEDDSALREAMRAVGRSLAGDSLAKDLADALAQADAERARREAERLAAVLADRPPPEPARKQLARALERAGKRKPAGDQDDKLRRAEDEVERLLKKQRENGELSEQDKRLLKKKQRELEQLQREQAERERAERQLDELQRELGQSGGALGQGQQQRASQHMQRGARSLQKIARQQLSAEQREKLQRALQQLRELMSKQQQGKGGDQQQQQGQAGNGKKLDLSRFGRLARGQTGQGGEQQGQPQPGGEQGTLLVPGGGGEPQGMLEMDGDGSGEQRLQLERGVAVGGTSAGQGGRPQSLPEPTNLDGERVDTRVQGELGQGPSRSQVIREAGQQGFATRGYQQVHADYSRHAETVLEHDKVPGGYRFYVRRYFQLIRPRTEAPPPGAGAAPEQETHD